MSCSRAGVDLNSCKTGGSKTFCADAGRRLQSCRRPNPWTAGASARKRYGPEAEWWPLGFKPNPQDPTGDWVYDQKLYEEQTPEDRCGN